VGTRQGNDWGIIQCVVLNKKGGKPNHSLEVQYKKFRLPRCSVATANSKGVGWWWLQLNLTVSWDNRSILSGPMTSLSQIFGRHAEDYFQRNDVQLSVDYQSKHSQLLSLVQWAPFNDHKLFLLTEGVNNHYIQIEEQKSCYCSAEPSFFRYSTFMQKVWQDNANFLHFLFKCIFSEHFWGGETGGNLLGCVYAEFYCLLQN